MFKLTPQVATIAATTLARMAEAPDGTTLTREHAWALSEAICAEATDVEINLSAAERIVAALRHAVDLDNRLGS